MSLEQEEHFKGNLRVKLRKGEPVEKALRRIKKKLDREQILWDLREKRYFIPPSKKRYLKTKELAFRDMLRRRHEDM